MPVFDFSYSPEKTKVSECTYTVFRTNAPFTSPDQPILILDTKEKAFPHHPCGIFTNPAKRTSFEFKEEEESFIADILQIDARFVSLLKWLGENHINVRLSGTQTSDGYAVYKIREIAFGGGAKLSAEDGFLQFMIERLLASNAPERRTLIWFSPSHFKRLTKRASIWRISAMKVSSSFLNSNEVRLDGFVKIPQG